jgi:hypothetical protein
VAARRIGAAICGSRHRGAAAGTVSRACAPRADGLLHPSRRRAGGLRSSARWHSVVLTVHTNCGGAAPLRCHCRAARTGRRRRSQHPCVAHQTRIAEPYTAHPHRRPATTERRLSPTRFIRRHAALNPIR